MQYGQVDFLAFWPTFVPLCKCCFPTVEHSIFDISSIFGKKRRFPAIIGPSSGSSSSSGGRDKYLAKHNAFFDQLDLVTYEEVSAFLNG